jgi:hypothetical protein
LLLALVALAWTVWLLWGALPALRANSSRLKLGWLSLTLLGNMVSGYLGFEAFRALFNHMRPGLYPRPLLAHLYFTGQLMKHLPGRIWGVAYQSTTGHKATLVEWVGVTTVYMVLTAGFALWVSASVLGFMLGLPWGVLALVAGSATYGLLWRVTPLTVLLDLLCRIRVHALVRLCNALRAFADVDKGFKRTVLYWFAASWLVYLLAWAGYGLAWPDLTAADGIWLCAIYTVAWFAGYVSLVSPSGVGVRELVFVLLAHRFPPDAVAGMAVLGRVTLLAVDVLLGMVFAPFGRSVK